MTREEFLVNLFLVSDEEWTDGDVSQSLKDHDQTQRETIAEQRAEVARLREALQALMDVQNGPPLEKYRGEWECAMSKAESILKETP